MVITFLPFWILEAISVIISGLWEMAESQSRLSIASIFALPSTGAAIVERFGLEDIED